MTNDGLKKEEESTFKCYITYTSDNGHYPT